MEKWKIELLDLLEYLALAIGDELEAQGHNLTGNLINSLSPKLGEDRLTGMVLWEQYGETVNSGINRNKVPYAPGSGAKKSKYIDGLIRFVKLRGIASNTKKAKSIAFAIAQSHKSYGLPTVGSRRFSSTGRRTGAVEEALQKERKNTLDGAEQVALAFIEEKFFEGLEAILSSSKFIIIT